MLAGLDKVLEEAQREQRDRQEGQASIFAAMPAAPRELKLPEVAEWPQAERLQYEKEALGFYISGHPLAELGEDLARTGALRTSALAEAEDGVTVCLGGVVAALKTHVAKSGDTMAFITLEDMYGTAEVIVFADLFRSSARLLESDEPVLVRGRVSKDEKAVKLVAEKIGRLRGNGELRIRLEAAGLGVADLNSLRDLLVSRPGSRAVVLEWVEEGSGPVLVHSDLQVEEGAEVAEAVNALLGYQAA